MPDDLSEMFDEAMSEPDIEVDNPTGADENDTISAIEDIETIEDTDTNFDELPVADVEDDDFNWQEIIDRYGDRTIQLTVNGEIVEKPLRDLPGMAMMREDYSRKTAEVSKVEKAANWAQDVQASFQSDPIGTLEAFAKAYNVPFGQPAQPVADPYEDFDPEIAAVLRKMDEQEARHQTELQQVRQQTSALTDKQLMAEIQAEVSGLKSRFGDSLDEVEMLRIAATYNMPLGEAAEMIVGRQMFTQAENQTRVSAQADQAATARAEAARQSQKRRASGTATTSLATGGAANVSVDDFQTISDLFEIELNSTS